MSRYNLALKYSPVSSNSRVGFQDQIHPCFEFYQHSVYRFPLRTPLQPPQASRKDSQIKRPSIQEPSHSHIRQRSPRKSQPQTLQSKKRNLFIPQIRFKPHPISINSICTRLSPRRWCIRIKHLTSRLRACCWTGGTDYVCIAPVGEDDHCLWGGSGDEETDWLRWGTDASREWGPWSVISFAGWMLGMFFLWSTLEVWRWLVNGGTYKYWLGSIRRGSGFLVLSPVASPIIAQTRRKKTLWNGKREGAVRQIIFLRLLSLSHFLVCSYHHPWRSREDEKMIFGREAGKE